MTAQHSEIGASSAERWLACPGSVMLGRTFKQKTSPYAAEGTQAHTAAELLLKGKNITKFDEDMQDAAKIYSNVITKDMLNHGVATLHIESKVILHKEKGAYGTCDAWFYSDGVLYIYDFKYGKGKYVGAFNNAQMQYYALAVIRTFQLTPEKIVMVIVQPRMDNISRFEISMTDLLVVYDKIIVGIEAVYSNTPAYAAGAHCQFCPAFGSCETARNKIDEDFKDLPDMTELTPEQMAEYLDRAEFLKSWTNALREHAKTMLEFGGAIPGYEIKQGESNRKWINEKEIEQQLTPQYGDKIYTKKIKSPAQIEKLDKSLDISALVHREPTEIKLVKKYTDSEGAAGFVPFTESN